ncbi:septal ring lytic transglycosylase RlpA family protein [Pleomorphomonas sp. NRK KF1]|uniref:septal ring lytic transglycosylase RlpA family protein n=1 Tax=Pleomorphomonas sp. NRK KF1 TaxID=2943000 RepID=UPI002043206A|nr:septal ring lytic transglycosylase RlpA family protein [Pleomorphomonas sp. NRK KF1]MCM5551759.1 septal ring lytic transglycosylase RlpA family protein [Pleomorphomonas sp. NRK KF1]
MTAGRNGTRSTTKTLLTVMSTSLVLAIGVAGCGTTEQGPLKSAKAKVDPKYGVAPSPRVVAMGEAVPKGGGRAMVGKPYQIAGKTYVPRVDPDYKVVGLASWYGTDFHGRRTANGEVFDAASISAAHPTMPLPSYARLTSLASGRSVIVRVNDRGPFHSNRVLDMSQRAADMLGVKRAGVAKVRVEYIGPAPTEGDDSAFLLASYRGPSLNEPQAEKPNVMLAAVESLPGVKTMMHVFDGSDAPKAAPVAAPAVMAAAAPADAVGTPAPAIDVVPMPRPVETFDYVTIASADPADFVGQSQVAALTPAAFTQTVPLPQPRMSYAAPDANTYQPTVMFGDVALPPLPPNASGYAADRVSQAYQAVDGIGAGTGLSDLVSKLEGLAEPKPAVAHELSGPVVQLGVFGNPDNVAKVSAALSAYGTAVVTDISVSGRAMKLMRLTSLTVTPDRAIAAAEAAGIDGARLLR